MLLTLNIDYQHGKCFLRVDYLVIIFTKYQLNLRLKKIFSLKRNEKIVKKRKEKAKKQARQCLSLFSLFF